MKRIIKNWRKWVLSAMLWPTLVLAQTTQTTFQTVWNTQAQTGYSTAVNLRQIGQSGHLVSLIFTNAPAQVCSTVTGETMQFFLEGSFDNTNWVIIKNAFYVFGTVDANNNQATQLTGYGAYSYVRIRALWYAGGGVANIFAKCRLNGWYSGTVNGNRQPTDRLPADQDGYSRYTAVATSATTTTLVTSAGANKEITVWDMTICTAAANNVTIADSTPITLAEYTFSANGGCVTLPYVGLFYMNTDYGRNLTMTTSTAARTTVNLKALLDTP